MAQPAGGALRRVAFGVFVVLAGCRARSDHSGVTLTFPGSALGAEGEILHRQLARFMALHPGIRVVQRETPDAADQRHQLYVQWLNAGTSEPDLLQLDVVWTPEFAAAGWILPLDRFHPDTAAFFPATLAADRWADTLFAVPWFVDVGMLYWRRDLLPAPPASFTALDADARHLMGQGLHYGLVYQGARYEGLVTTFLEYLEGYGGHILQGRRVTVAEPPGVRALAEMRDQIYRLGVVPPSVLTWHEEETRFAFQNGEAAFMRNWPYASRLMEDSTRSRVAGRFGVAPMPAEPDGQPAATLGGAQLAINRHSRHPDSAWVVVDYLTRPEQMLERARALGQFPARRALYEGGRLTGALAVP
ncbi:MAG TPA: ABC transporter substrate-binding protein, partial [Gemmatimonadales bacterium]|nr:ABC transporter substrate-binding protein [Gemmatimonadales bacterium]